MRLKKNVELVSRSPEMLALQHELERVARSDAKVLITGESGVGKEIVARTIHAQSPRANHVFAPVNCAGLPETLLESELFGHVKGSFTGAYRDKPGKMETAHLGTVFLDEVGEMTLRMQGLLLRFLETGELQKVGADGGTRHVNVRIIAATNRDLRQLVAQGVFREDLFYRLNVIHIIVPPLRERRQDIPLLLNQFLVQFAAANGTPLLKISPDAMNALMTYSWPGNVRELENAIERLVVTQQGGVIECDHLPHEIRSAGSVRALAQNSERRRTRARERSQRCRENGD
jgi:two-component system response regulator AtoC